MKVKMCLKKKESVALNHRRHRSLFHEDHNQSKHRRKRKNPPKMKNFVYDEFMKIYLVGTWFSRTQVNSR